MEICGVGRCRVRACLHHSPRFEEKQLGEAGTEASQAQPDAKASEEAADAKKKDCTDLSAPSICEFCIFILFDFKYCMLYQDPDVAHCK